jgi:hypothetical protein
MIMPLKQYPILMFVLISVFILSAGVFVINPPAPNTEKPIASVIAEQASFIEDAGMLYYFTQPVYVSEEKVTLSKDRIVIVQKLTPVISGISTYYKWELVSENAEWTARAYHTSNIMQDGSIILMGGYGGYKAKFTNDVWKSTNGGATWTEMNTNPDWAPRQYHTSVTMADGNIVLMGGSDGTLKFKNDVWKSTDDGITWTLVTTTPGWEGRSWHTSVALEDNSILLMGGYTTSGSYKNDVWKSTDDGITWTLVNANAGWSPRIGHSSVLTKDGSIILMGGNTNRTVKNDVWKSTDDGATWSLVNASAGWSPRMGHTSVALSDGSIVLMGGNDGDYLGAYYNDVWKSTDDGATWKQIMSTAEWTPRKDQTCIVMPDGFIVLIGGNINGAEGIHHNDIWRFNPSKLFEQNAASLTIDKMLGEPR